MPIYEYKCQNCNEIHEVIQKFNDEKLHSCPSCGGQLKKLISQSTFILKGTGWYVTDYARKNNSNNGANNREQAENLSKKDEQKEKT